MTAQAMLRWQTAAAKGAVLTCSRLVPLGDNVGAVASRRHVGIALIQRLQRARAKLSPISSCHKTPIKQHAMLMSETAVHRCIAKARDLGQPISGDLLHEHCCRQRWAWEQLRRCRESLKGCALATVPQWRQSEHNLVVSAAEGSG